MTEVKRNRRLGLTSTRSYICKEQDDGSYIGVYCHCDGYLTHNGAMLLDHYNAEKRVDKLLSMGNMSCLGEKISPDPNEPHSFDAPQEDVCLFYARDRGELEQEAVPVNFEDLEDPASWIRYVYVYGRDGRWRYFECGHLNEGLKDLKLGLEEEYRNLGFPRPKGYYGSYTEDDVKQLREAYVREEEKE